MKNKPVLLFLLTLLLACSTAFGADDLRLLPNWKVGEKKKMLIRQPVLTNQSGLPAGTLLLQTELTVTGADEVSYEVQWKVESAKYEEAQPASTPAGKALSEILKGLVLKYKVAENGQLEQITNWIEAVAHVEGNAKGAQASRTKKMGEVEAQKMIAGISGQIAGQEQLQALLGNKIRLFHLLYGKAYAPATKVKGTAQIAAGGKLVEARMEAELKKQFDFATTADFAAQLEIPAAAVQKPTPVKQELEYEINVATGWPVAITGTSSANYNSNAFSDSFSLTVADQ